jgi:predicted DNA-binding protein with PD1-like motif
MKTKRIESVEHRLLLLEKGDRWPECVVEALEKSGLTSGTFRGTAVLRDVEVRAYDAGAGAREPGRTLEGPVEALVLEGAFGLTRGSLAITTRAVLAMRDSFGERVTAGSVEGARIDGGEVVVTGFPGTDIVRTLRADAGVWLFQLEAEMAASPGVARARDRDDDTRGTRPASTAAPGPSSAWAALADASDAVTSAPIRNDRLPKASPPGRPAAPSGDDDEVFVEQGAVVDHFSFGEGDVLKSDGERVHVRFERDGRIREFSLGVLKVTPAGTRRGKPYFKVTKRG